jgi:hypothetical protein
MPGRSPKGDLALPGGKKFAFTILDDCDNSTDENTRPFYDLLVELGMRTTRTVFVFNSPEVHPYWQRSTTLEDERNRALALDLQAQGFEIASHGASMMSSTRDRTARALEVFHQTFGHYPRLHANHGYNRENLYWLGARFSSRLIARLYALRAVSDGLASEGHTPESPYFWGDLCQKHINYVRGFSFPVLDLRPLRSSLLYRDPATPFVNFWFSSSHAFDVEEFNQLLSLEGQESLERDGGVSIVTTHVAQGFVRNGVVQPVARRLLESMAARDGWFVPVSTLLDHLREHGFGKPLGWFDRRVSEFRWARGALRRGIGR